MFGGKYDGGARVVVLFYDRGAKLQLHCRGRGWIEGNTSLVYAAWNRRVSRRNDDLTSDAYYAGMRFFAGLTKALRRNPPSLRKERTKAIDTGPYANVPIYELVREVESMAKVGFWRLDATTGTVFWSPEVFAIHEMPVCDEVDVEEAMSFYPGENLEKMKRAIKRALSHAEPYELELDFLSAQGTRKRVRAHGKPQGEAGKVRALLGVFQDITEAYQLECRMRDQACSDPLTSLANRRYLVDYFEKGGFADAARTKPFACAIIDLDHFKRINDTHGHHAGDQVLCAMAKRLQADWLGESFAARLGGDELLLLLEDRELLTHLTRTIQRLLNEFSIPVQTQRGELPVSATLGIAWFDKGGLDLDVVLQCADTALYAAKNAQRGSARIATRDDLFLDLGKLADSKDRLVA